MLFRATLDSHLLGANTNVIVRHAMQDSTVLLAMAQSMFALLDKNAKRIQHDGFLVYKVTTNSCDPTNDYYEITNSFPDPENPTKKHLFQ